MTKVSIIVPNYNHASYLSQRIESILNQTYQDFELILMDDCSTDNSREVIEQYRTHPKVSGIVFNTENSGSTFKQWNKGFELAKGEWIWIAESDDYSEITFLENLFKGIENNCDVVIAYSTSYIVDEKGKIIRDGLQSEPYLKAKAGRKSFKVYDGVDYIKKHLLKTNDIYNASSAIFRKSSLENVSKDFLTYKSCGDKLFWLEIAKQGKVVYVYESLNYFRQHTIKVSPHAITSGRLFEEELRIYHYSIKKGYISNFSKLFVIGFYLAWINKVPFDSENIKAEILKKWKNLIFFPDLCLNLNKLNNVLFEIKFRLVHCIK